MFGLETFMMDRDETIFTQEWSDEHPSMNFFNI